jgi:acyl-CoA reductase-like NAD-dependent aldehyde dehydrogenase
VEHAAIILEEWYGPKLKASGDIGRIINRNHFNRLSRLLNETKGKIALGGDLDPNDLWISPTLVGI